MAVEIKICLGFIIFSSDLLSSTRKSDKHYFLIFAPMLQAIPNYFGTGAAPGNDCALIVKMVITINAGTAKLISISETGFELSAKIVTPVYKGDVSIGFKLNGPENITALVTVNDKVDPAAVVTDENGKLVIKARYGDKLQTIEMASDGPNTNLNLKGETNASLTLKPM